LCAFEEYPDSFNAQIAIALMVHLRTAKVSGNVDFGVAITWAWRPNKKCEAPVATAGVILVRE